MRSSPVMAALIWLCSICLGGCVTSELPLLDNASAIVDTSLTGHYRLVPPSIAGEQVTLQEDIYLKENSYLVVEGGKLVAIATVHQFTPKLYLTQMRFTGKSSSASGSSAGKYVYFLARKSERGFEFNTIHCATAGTCELSNMRDLEAMASSAAADFTGGDYGASVKIGDVAH